MRFLRVMLALLSAVALQLTFTSQAHAGMATLKLPVASTTSVGIFDAQGRLVRTIWSGRRFNAGPVAILWNGLDDDGKAVPATGSYTVKLLAHDVRYVWEGVIGNTSADQTGTSKHRAFNPINDMAFDKAGNGFYAVGYNEQQNALHRFRATDAQRQTPLSHDDYRRLFRFVATDGNLVYFANTGVLAPKGSFAREPASFVVALSITDNSEYRFATGRDVMPAQSGNRWFSAIDYDQTDVEYGTGFRNAPTGLAVQQRGNLLFIAHAPLNEVRLLDKRDGRQLGRIAVSNPRNLAVAADDSLWVLAGPTGSQVVQHYELRSGQWQLSTEIRDGAWAPVALAVSPVDSSVLVADSNAEQVKAFEGRSGRALWTSGQAGGYRSGGPQVTTDRFWLSAGVTYIAVQPDGSFWLGDPGNSRNLHFSPARAVLEQIAYQVHNYVLAVDPANPSRVFSGFYEFAVDYTKPIGQSWLLVRNWATAVPALYRGEFEGLQSVYTLSNGRTYGVLRRFDSGNTEIAELTSNGLRFTGIRVDLGTRLAPDGSLRLQLQRFNALTFYQRKLTCFDASGNPQWDAPQSVASVNALAANDPYYHDVPLINGINEASYPVTSSGLLVSFNPGKSAGFHLGGLMPGSTQWQWRASPTAPWLVDAAGNVEQATGQYDVTRGVQYLGNVAMAQGKQVVFGYHGEAWNGGQANQWLHYYDNGLFVGQFGKPLYAHLNRTNAAAETAGNAFSPQLVQVNDNLYLWHNDEGAHSGLHRWRIDGLKQMTVLEAPISR